MQSKQNQDILGNAIFQGAGIAEPKQGGTGQGAGGEGQQLAVNAADEVAAAIAGARAALPGAAIGALLLDVGRQAAQIQARKLLNLRGVSPSQTSIDDAAADGTAHAVRVGLRLVRAGVDLSKDYSPRVRHNAKGDGRLVRRSARAICLLYASRGSFRSLCSWASVGITGDNTFKFSGGSFVSEFTGELANTLAAARDEGAGDCYQVESIAARWRVIRWLYSVGVRDFAAMIPADTRGTARAQMMAAAVARCRVVADCVLGLPMADAIKAGGYASGEAFGSSCIKSNFFPSLQAAAGRNWGDARQARLAMRAAAVAAGVAIKAQHLADGGGAPMGWRQLSDCITIEAIALTGEGSQWQAAAGARGQAVALAIWWRDISHKRAAAAAVAFEAVRRGLRGDKFGDLGKVFCGRSRRSNKLAAMFIRSRPSGKVIKPATSQTVAVKVGRVSRAVPCAPLVADDAKMIDCQAAGLAPFIPSPVAVAVAPAAVAVAVAIDWPARRAAQAAARRASSSRPVGPVIQWPKVEPVK